MEARSDIRAIHPSLDHCIGAHEERGGAVKTESAGGLRIEHKFMLGRYLDWT